MLACGKDRVLIEASDRAGEGHVWMELRPGACSRSRTDLGVFRAARGRQRLAAGRSPARRGAGPSLRVARRGRSAATRTRPACPAPASPAALGPRQMRAALLLPSWYGPDRAAARAAGPVRRAARPAGGCGPRRVPVLAVVRRPGLRGPRGRRPGHARARRPGTAPWRSTRGPGLEDQVDALQRPPSSTRVSSTSPG